jgi:hypothetical protein
VTTSAVASTTAAESATTSLIFRLRDGCMDGPSIAAAPAEPRWSATLAPTRPSRKVL